MEVSLTIAGVVVVLGIAFMLIFRTSIRGFLSRVRSVDVRGVRIDSPQRGTLSEKDPQAEAEILIRELDSALIREVETHLNNELQKRELTGEAALRVTVRYLAANYIAFDFERIYRLIWGSQLNLLSYLNTQLHGHPAEALRTFYTLAASQYPEAYTDYSYDQWLAFMKEALISGKTTAA